ncbi:MAG TPA: alpha/beta fold hydrolase [Chlorobaculum sp.]|nr:alpha/beta fold hydrolase [Chlorobaculum sp.]
MNADWIVHEGGRDLLLFFNGWGMDRKVADSIRTVPSAWPDRDIVVLYDYRDLELPDWLRAAMAGYRSIDLVAWSLGVWAAMHTGLEGIRRAVAINGTPYPVDAERGISPEIFQGTLENWSDVNRRRFERRMFIGCPEDRLDEIRSSRSAADQQEELRSIADAVTRLSGTVAPSWSFSRVLIGGRDLVFLPENQRSAWQDVPVTEFADMPHFPFFHLDGCREVFE